MKIYKKILNNWQNALANYGIVWHIKIHIHFFE